MRYVFVKRSDSPRGYDQACCYCSRTIPKTRERWFLLNRAKLGLGNTQIHTGCLAVVARNLEVTDSLAYDNLNGDDRAFLSTAQTVVRYDSRSRRIREVNA